MSMRESPTTVRRMVDNAVFGNCWVIAKKAEKQNTL